MSHSAEEIYKHCKSTTVKILNNSRKETKSPRIQNKNKNRRSLKLWKNDLESLKYTIKNLRKRDLKNKKEWLLQDYRVSFWGWWACSGINGTCCTTCAYTKTLWIIHFKIVKVVNFVIWILSKFKEEDCCDTDRWVFSRAKGGITPSHWKGLLRSFSSLYSKILQGYI